MGENLQQVFDDLHARYRMRVYSLAYSLTAHRDDAEDLTQETFARAWRSFESLRDHASPFAWLRAILVNAFRDRLAKRGQPTAPEPAPAPDPYEIACRREELHVLRAIIHSLPERDRVAIDLSHLQGHSNREIAAILGVSEDHVRVILHRARERLTEALRNRLGNRRRSS